VLTLAHRRLATENDLRHALGGVLATEATRGVRAAKDRSIMAMMGGTRREASECGNFLAGFSHWLSRDAPPSPPSIASIDLSQRLENHNARCPYYHINVCS
jgi:hypothetical protein